MPSQRRTLPEPVPPEPVASSAIPRDRRAWDVAGDAAAAIRTLNHLTLNHLTQTGAGYGEPADLDAVLVELSVLAARLPQALDQARAWLNGRHDVGAVVHETRPGQTDRTVQAVADDLRTAAHIAHDLAGALDSARQHTAHLAGRRSSADTASTAPGTATEDRS